MAKKKTEQTKQPEKKKVVLYRGILHTEGYKIEDAEGSSELTEEEKKIITDYMKAWDGVHVTLSNLLPEEYSVVGWPPEEEEKVKNAIYLMEQDFMFGNYVDDREKFEADWAAGTWEPSGSIIFSTAMVEILEELGGPKENDYDGE